MTPQEKLIARYWGLPTLADIAAQVRMNRSSVCAVGKRLGLPARKRGPQGPIGPVDPAYILEVHHRLLAGDTITSIAAHYGVTPQAISQLATLYGFPVRELRRRQRRAA